MKRKGQNNNSNSQFYNIENISKKDFKSRQNVKKFVVNEKICNAKYVKINNELNCMVTARKYRKIFQLKV